MCSYHFHFDIKKKTSFKPICVKGFHAFACNQQKNAFDKGHIVPKEREKKYEFGFDYKMEIDWFTMTVNQ